MEFVYEHYSLPFLIRQVIAGKSFANRPVSRLIRWYNKPCGITKFFFFFAIQFHGIFHGLKITNWLYLHAKLSGIHLCKSCEKFPHKSCNIFSNIPSGSRDFFPNEQKMFIFHRHLLLNNTNNFPWVKILGNVIIS